MRVEMVKLNKVKVATSEEQKKLLAGEGYQVLLELPEEKEAESTDAAVDVEPKKGSKGKIKKEDSDGEGDAGQK